MTDEIRRRKTTDPEMDAMMVIVQAFSDLDRSAATRVLRWAEDRYVREEPILPPDGMKAVNQFMTGIEEIARRLGKPPTVVLKAMERVANEVPKVEAEEEASRA